MKKVYCFILILFNLMICACKMEDSSISTIAVASFPEKTLYYRNELLDLSGLVVNSVYSDGKYQIITNYSVTPEDGSELTKIGKQKIIISAGGYKTSFFVNVKEIELSSLQIISFPDKVIYKENEKLNLDGLLLRAEYNNGISRNITQNNLVCDPPINTVLNKLGSQRIKVSYDNKTVEFSVYIQEKEPEYTSLPVIKVQPENKVALVNTIASINCEVEEPWDGIIQYQWYTSNDGYEPFELLENSNMNSINIYNNGEKLDRYYYVIVKNVKEGKVTSSVKSRMVHIQFIEPIEILSQTKKAKFDLYNYEQKLLQVKYQTQSKGKLNISWFKKSKKIGESDEIVKQESINSILTNEKLNNITEYIVPNNDFSDHEVGVHDYYVIINLENENVNYTKESEAIELESCLPDTGLMKVIINTDSGEDPTGVYLRTLGYTSQPVVADKEKVPASIKIIQNDKLLYNGKLDIKLRGNGSAYLEKKPYKLKLYDNVDLLFTGDSQYQDKDWVLLAEGQSLDTPFGFEVSRICGFDWVPHYKYVDLVLNDIYRGTYLLTESIKVNKTRIDLSKTGYLVEGDGKVTLEAKYNTKIAAPIYFKTDNASIYSFKFPDDDDLTVSQIEYIKNVMTQMENSISNGNYNETIDIQSFAMWFLVHDIIGQNDPGGTNKYYSKYDNTENSKIKMSTPWDFQDGYIRKKANKWTELHNIDGYKMKDLFNSENRMFVNEFKSLWYIIEPELYDNCMNKFEKISDDYGQSINKSRILDGIRWGVNRNSIEYEIENIDTWLTKRIEWINSNIDSL